jgi:hypothetical protein
MNEKLTKCKTCGEEIAKNIKKCPKCGADQRNFFMKHKVISVIGIFVILGIIGSVAGNNSKSNYGQTGKDTSTTQTQQTNTKSTTDTKQQEKPKYEILNHKMITDDDGIKYVTGQIKNNSGKTSGYVQVEINLYDSNNTQLGSTLANLNNLEDGKVWNFKAPVTEDNTASYKIMNVTGF